MPQKRSFTVAKIDNAAICEALAAKGLDLAEDNPNLIKVARSLGILTEPLHAVSVVHNVPKVGQVPEATDKSKSYLAVSGGARGRDAWFPVTSDRTPRQHAESLRDACEDFLADTE